MNYLQTYMHWHLTFTYSYSNTYFRIIGILLFIVLISYNLIQTVFRDSALIEIFSNFLICKYMQTNRSVIKNNCIMTHQNLYSSLMVYIRYKSNSMVFLSDLEGCKETRLAGHGHMLVIA